MKPLACPAKKFVFILEAVRSLKRFRGVEGYGQVSVLGRALSATELGLGLVASRAGGAE